MKRMFTALLTFAVMAGVCTQTWAAKKNEPKMKDVERLVQEAGGVHFPDKLDISKIGPVKVGESFFFAYTGSAKKGGYRVIIFDNEKHYLGFYETGDFEPSEAGPGSVLIDDGTGESFFKIKFKKGEPPKKVDIDGTPQPFVKNEKAEEDKAAAAAAAEAAKKANEPIKAEYREWTLNMRGKAVTFEAIYIRQAGNKVFLKEKKRGVTKDFPVNRLSAADQEYISKMK